LITGEERIQSGCEELPSKHVSCTVEMCSVQKKCKKFIDYLKGI